jgi:hypothetical protein
LAFIWALSLFSMSDATIPPDPATLDLKWGVLVGFAAVTLPLPKLKEPALILDSVARTFRENLQRINWMILTPSLVGDLTIQIQRCFDTAELQITGELAPLLNLTEHPKQAEISRVAQAIFNLNTNEIIGAIGTPQYDQFVLNAIDQGTQPVVMLAGQGAPARLGIAALLSSCVTGTWTAFETMASDLWAAALNIHPVGLAELKGRRKRLLTDDEASSAEVDAANGDVDKDNIKTVPLSEILRHEFKIEHAMGNVLRTRRRFDHLAGIKEAYALAFFKKSEKIDAILKDKSFEALNAVRNLIVHHAGIVDRTYERKAKYLDIPNAPIGFPIFLDGETVMKLMRSVIVCSFNLITAVDDWIAEN